jgi:hypothetical protein
MVFFGLIPVKEMPEGRISYPSSFSYRGSAVGFFSFGILCLLLSGILLSWFLLGGAFGCLVTASSHWRLSNQASSGNGQAN